ncbi:uncharacterized protein LOC142335017 isoform X2 [Convolutriloba macropyga]
MTANSTQQSQTHHHHHNHHHPHSASLIGNSSVGNTGTSHGSKTKEISTKLATLETEINQFESKIARLMKKRDERTRQSSANSALLTYNNNNNSINKPGSVLSMGAGVLTSESLGSLKSSASSEVSSLDGSFTDIKQQQLAEQMGAVTSGPNDPSSRLHQLPNSEIDTNQYSCSCFARSHSADPCPHREACTRNSNVKHLVDSTRKVEEQDLIYKIYSHNRKNVDFLHRMMGANPNLAEIPKYAQPCETPAYHANRKKFVEFKSKLVESISRQKKTLHEADERCAEQYDSSYSQWISKVQSQKNSAKRRAKDAKNREFFEKIFPDLKKRREQDERIARMGTRGSGKSEFEIEEIASSLRQQELNESEMHRNAVIPPLCVNRLGTNKSKPPVKYMDSNRYIEDPLALYKQTQNISAWTEQQQKVFRDKYLVHPKNFAAVSNAVGKPIEECVKFYYLKKPTENYKKQVRSNSIKRKRDPKIKPNRTITPQPSEVPRSISPPTATSTTQYPTSSSSSSSSLMVTTASSANTTLSIAATTHPLTSVANNTTTTTATSINSGITTMSLTTGVEASSSSDTNSVPGQTSNIQHGSDEKRLQQQTSSEQQSVNAAAASNAETASSSSTHKSTLTTTNSGSATGVGSSSNNNINSSSNSAAVLNSHNLTSPGNATELNNTAISTSSSTLSQNQQQPQQLQTSNVHDQEARIANLSSASRTYISANQQNPQHPGSEVESNTRHQPYTLLHNRASAMIGGSANPGSLNEDVFTRVVNSAQSDLARNAIVFTSVAPSLHSEGNKNLLLSSANKQNCKPDDMASNIFNRIVGGGLTAHSTNMLRTGSSAGSDDAHQKAAQLGIGSNSCVGSAVLQINSNTSVNSASNNKINSNISASTGSPIITPASTSGASYPTAAGALSSTIGGSHSERDLYTQQQHHQFILQQQQNSNLALLQNSNASSGQGLKPSHHNVERSSLHSISPAAGLATHLQQQQHTNLTSPPIKEKSATVKNCCPVPLCTYKNKHRKLKFVHFKWECLSQEQKDSLHRELGISEGVTRACASCYNRITQLLDPEHVIGGPHDDLNVSQSHHHHSQLQIGNSASPPVCCGNSTSTAANSFKNSTPHYSGDHGNSAQGGSGGVVWTREEEETFQSVLKNYGPKWDRLNSAIPTKSRAQISSYYLDNKDRLSSVLHEWTKSTVANRRNRIGSNSNATRGSHSYLGRSGNTGSSSIGSGHVEGGGNSSSFNPQTTQPGSDDTDYFTDDADDAQPNESLIAVKETPTSASLSPSSTATGLIEEPDMKSYIMRKYNNYPPHPRLSPSAVPGKGAAGTFEAGSCGIGNTTNGVGGNHQDITNIKAATQSALAKAYANNNPNNGGDGKHLTIDELIIQGIDNEVSPEEKDLEGTPLVNLFKEAHSGCDLLKDRATQGLLQHSPLSVGESQNQSPRYPGGSSAISPSAVIRAGFGGGGGANVRTTALEMMKSRIRDAVGEGPQSKQLRVDPSQLQNTSSVSAISPSSLNSSGNRNTAEKTSPISPTPLNHSRPSSKGTSNAPPVPPPLLHITSAHDRKSPLVNPDKIQQLVNSYGANSSNAAATLGGSLSQGIQVPYPSLISEMTPEQQVLAAVARQLPGGLQLNGLNGQQSSILMANELLRRGALDIPRTTSATLGPSLKTVTNDLLATDYLTSQTMDSAHKNKQRTSPPNSGLSVVAPPSSSTNLNSSVPRRPDAIVAAPTVAAPAANGPLAAAAALQNLPNLQHQALLDPQLSYLLQNQQLQQHLQQLYLPPQSTNKQLFVPPAPANHPIGWPLLSSVGGAAAAPPWPYPGPVPGAPPPPPTTSTSLRPHGASHPPTAFQHLTAAVSNAGSYTNGSVTAAEYARHLELSDPLLLQKIAEVQHLETLLKAYPGLSKEHADALNNLQWVNTAAGNSTGNSAAAAAAAQEANRLAAHQTKTAPFDVNLFKGSPVAVASVASAMAASEREREKNKAIVAAQQNLLLASHSTAATNNYLKRSANEMTPLTLPSSINPNANKVVQQQSAVLSSSLQRVPPATTGAAVSSAPPMNKVPKLSPSDVREQQRVGSGGGNLDETSAELMLRKRPISPSMGKPYASSAKKLIHASEHLTSGNSSHVSLVETSNSSRSNVPINRTVNTSNSSGAINNAQLPLQPPPSAANPTAPVSSCPSLATSSKSQSSGTIPSSATSIGGSHTSTLNSSMESGKSNGGGASIGSGSGSHNGSNSGSSYQMQKSFSDNYHPKYYRPHPMLKPSSKKEEHAGSSSTSGNSNSISSNSNQASPASGAKNNKHQNQQQMPRENGYTQSKESSKENKDTNQTTASVPINSKHHNVSKTSPVSNNSASAHSKPLVHEVAKS